MAIKIGIIEDDDKFREALCRYLEFQDDFEIIGHASDKYSAISTDLFSKADVLLVDCYLTEGIYDGIEIVKAIAERSENQMKIIMLSSIKYEDIIKTSF